MSGTDVLASTISNSVPLASSPGAASAVKGSPSSIFVNSAAPATTNVNSTINTTTTFGNVAGPQRVKATGEGKADADTGVGVEAEAEAADPANETEAQKEAKLKKAGNALKERTPEFARRFIKGVTDPKALEVIKAKDPDTRRGFFTMIAKCVFLSAASIMSKATGYNFSPIDTLVGNTIKGLKNDQGQPITAANLSTLSKPQGVDEITIDFSEEMANLNDYAGTFDQKNKRVRIPFSTMLAVQMSYGLNDQQAKILCAHLATHYHDKSWLDVGLEETKEVAVGLYNMAKDTVTQTWKQSGFNPLGALKSFGDNLIANIRESILGAAPEVKPDPLPV